MCLKEMPAVATVQLWSTTESFSFELEICKFLHLCYYHIRFVLDSHAII